MRTRVSTGTRYREISGSAPATLRPILCVAALLISLALVYGAIRAGHGLRSEHWLLAVALAGLFVARGLHLFRPVTLVHVTMAVVAIVVGDFAYRADHLGIGFVAIAAAGLMLMLPQRSTPQPQELCRVAGLVDRTEDDPLAPFAFHSSKSYYFNEAGTAAIAYRTRIGMAVVAGDPIGNADDFPELINEFAEFARLHGWRIAVLGAGVRATQLWRITTEKHPLAAVAIGRDVVIDVDTFALEGRTFRNLRQAVSRTHNAGVSTEIVWETAISDETRAELLAIVDEWHAGRQTRGFSMILDHLLDGRHPGMLLVIARDATGRAVGFQRYGTNSAGLELSIDVPWRSKNSPNGIDERMTIDLIEHAKSIGARRVSLAFAAFPELFENEQRSLGASVAYATVHMGDALLCLESLYRFLRKFRSFGDQRFVLLRPVEVIPAAFALLTLEFMPNRSQY
ncbi:bifunctional lysylphosphatidylglycerol flippase/synthetase MprF [Antrihabitans cavernicola]|uniref:DUF2156 domain-containing protein n=1 Tax=Antrihabitans cavernicola TaxID=2495913 RepID=A0A5A7SBP4_9NOCA|nr:phosphatidylglycerol lysyltransferase domain-containing protein [Spelaeibacter cavernicola]KAA0022572.1 DUF2156 domain-containing protein [Spelaeibacter cavernicola]